MNLLTFLAPLALVAEDGGDIMTTVGLVVLVLFLFAFLVVFLKFAKLYIQSVLAGASVGLFDMLAMSLRKVNPAIIVEGRINLVQARIDGIQSNDLEAHALAGGNVPRVVSAIISADKASLGLDFQTATGIDLATATSLTPCAPAHLKVIDPGSRQGQERGCRGEGRHRGPREGTSPSAITSRASPARVRRRSSPGWVRASSRPSAPWTPISSFREPDSISKTVLDRGLDAGTVFEIVSIDIADVDIGHNIGARFQADQAEADKAPPRPSPRSAGHGGGRGAGARRPPRRTAQRSSRPRPRCCLRWPMRCAPAPGVMDMLRLKNIESDTTMRRSIGGIEPTGGGTGSPARDRHPGRVRPCADPQSTRRPPGYVVLFVVVVWPIIRGCSTRLWPAHGVRAAAARGAALGPAQRRRTEPRGDPARGPHVEALEEPPEDVVREVEAAAPPPLPREQLPEPAFGERPEDEPRPSERELVGDPFDDSVMGRDLVDRNSLADVPTEDELEVDVDRGARDSFRRAVAQSASPSAPGAAERGLGRLERGFTPWQRAFVLKEILGAPAATRAFDDDRF